MKHIFSTTGTGIDIINNEYFNVDNYYIFKKRKPILRNIPVFFKENQSIQNNNKYIETKNNNQQYYQDYFKKNQNQNSQNKTQVIEISDSNIDINNIIDNNTIKLILVLDNISIYSIQTNIDIDNILKNLELKSVKILHIRYKSYSSMIINTTNINQDNILKLLNSQLEELLIEDISLESLDFLINNLPNSSLKSLNLS